MKKLKDHFGSKLKEHEVMRNHTSLKVGGVADFYLETETIDELIDCLEIARDVSIPYLLIGSGTNIIFSDFGFPGLVICNKAQNISYLLDKSQIIVDSGIRNSALVMLAANKHLGGIEYLGSLSGTLGSVVYNNRSLDRYSLSQYVKKITIFSPHGEILTYKHPWLKSTSCSTRLKEIKSNINLDEDKAFVPGPIILTVSLQLQRSRQEDIVKRIQEIKALQPKIVDGQSGQIFCDTQRKSAIELLLESGAKKLKIGDAIVASHNPNSIINRKNAQANDIKNLIEEMRQLVAQKTGEVLKETIEFVGVW